MSTITAPEIFARFVRFTAAGDHEEFRIEIRGEDNTVVAVGPQGAERRHGGRIGIDRARENAAGWADKYGEALERQGFMRVI